MIKRRPRADWKRAGLLMLGLLAAPALAQASPAPTPLKAQIESLLRQPTRALAEAAAEELLRTKATGKELLAALRAPHPKPPPAGESQLTLHLAGRAIPLQVVLPEGYAVQPQRPVVLHILLGRIPDRIVVAGAANAYFRDPGNGRGGAAEEERWLDLLRAFAQRVGGDPQRMWLAGFSWGGHGVWSTALHHAAQVQGLIPMAGAPQRTLFRLGPNLKGLSVRASVGAKDDRELIWNLEELVRRTKPWKFECTLGLDQLVSGRLMISHVHTRKLGEELAAAVVAKPSKRGKLLADGAGCTLPWLRVERIDESRVQLPERIPVPASASFDAQRRKVLKAMEKRVVSLGWTQTEQADQLRLRLRPKGVSAVTLRVPATWLAYEELSLSGFGKSRVMPLAADAKVMLMHTWEHGRRHEPTVQLLRLER